MPDTPHAPCRRCKTTDPDVFARPTSAYCQPCWQYMSDHGRRRFGDWCRDSIAQARGQRPRTIQRVAHEPLGPRCCPTSFKCTDWPPITRAHRLTRTRPGWAAGGQAPSSPSTRLSRALPRFVEVVGERPPIMVSR
jgi:hypothetical protein